MGSGLRAGRHCTLAGQWGKVFRWCSAIAQAGQSPSLKIKKKRDRDLKALFYSKKALELIELF